MRNIHSNEFEAPIPVYYSKDELEPKQIAQRGLRAKLPLYNDVMTKDGLMFMTNEEIEKIVDKFNSIGCTSFMLTSEEIEQLLEQHERENKQ